MGGRGELNGLLGSMRRLKLVNCAKSIVSYRVTSCRKVNLSFVEVGRVLFQ